MNNPTLTEFCFGMIGRADIEGSKSNVAMNAWLPQASSVIPAILSIAQSLLGLCGPVDDCTLSSGRSPYLRCIFKCTHTLASVELPSYDSGSQVSCGLSLFFKFLPICLADYMEVLPFILGIEDLSRCPRIQVCCRMPHKHISMRSD